jgi:hypothetical protein
VRPVLKYGAYVIIMANNGFYIMIWDGWSQGLNPINPQLLPLGGKDMYGYPKFWCQFDFTDEEIIQKYNLEGLHFKIIR